MSTNSTISITRIDGTITSIYCHWDGYIEHNGVILQRYYNTPEKVEELIALGDLSALGETIENCVAYHRDRGETFRQTGTGMKQEFNYEYDEAERCWKIKKSVFMTDTPAQEYLQIKYYDMMCENLLLNEILNVDVKTIWCEDGTEEETLKECIEKAKEARQPIIEQQIKEWNEMYAYQY